MMFYINVANSNRSKYSRIGGMKDGKFKQKDTANEFDPSDQNLNGVKRR